MLKKLAFNRHGYCPVMHKEGTTPYANDSVSRKMQQRHSLLWARANSFASCLLLVWKAASATPFDKYMYFNGEKTQITIWKVANLTKKSRNVNFVLSAAKIAVCRVVDKSQVRHKTIFSPFSLELCVFYSDIFQHPIPRVSLRSH